MTKRRVRKFKKKLIYIIPIILLFVVILGGVFFLNDYNFSFFTKEEVKEERKVQLKAKIPREYTARLFMVGDALIHDSIYRDARVSKDVYDFRPMFEFIKPISSKYDLAYYNQETILGGASLGYSNYPRFNSPQEVGDAFLDSGFNMISLATNHTMDKGEQGVINSVNYWSSKKDIAFDGQRTSQEERDKARIYEKNGIKYAFFSYTTWTNGLETPIGKEYLNNVYSDEKAKVDIEKVRDKVDFVIVAMHWGNEYSLGVSQSQTNIANYLSSLGVDLIIGAHPHVVEPVEWINNGKTLVIYSLGNFISDQEGNERLTGLMMEVTLKKKVDGDGVTTNNIINPKAELIYTKSYYGGKRNFKVYPYPQLNTSLLKNYTTLYEKYKGIVSSRYPELVWGVTGE